MAKYVTEQGIRLVINDYKNRIDVKADKSQLANFATKEDLNNIEIPETDLTNYATKNDVASAIANIQPYDDSSLKNRIDTLEGGLEGVYHFKGNKADLNTLISEVQNPAVGDAYNLLDTGMNVAWTGEAWDEFGTPYDLSVYAKKEDIQAITLEELNAILFNGKTAVVNDLSSLKAMIDNNQSEVEITINDNLALTEKIEIPIGKKVVLNFEDGTKLTSAVRALEITGGELELHGGSVESTDKAIAVYNGGKVTIDGTDIISSENSGIGVYGTSSEVTLNSGSVEGLYGLTAFHGGTIIINGGSATGLDGAAISGNGSKYFNPETNKFGSNAGDGFVEQAPINVVINGGTFEGQSTTEGDIAAGIYWPGKGTLTINNGTIVSNGAGIVMRGGTVNLNEGTTVIASGDSGITGKVGDARQVVGPYAIVYDKNSKYPAYETLELNIAQNVILQGTDGDIQYILPEGDEEINVNDNR